MHLDTVCTMVEADAVVMYPAIQDTLAAFTLRKEDDGVSIRGATPFLEAAARRHGNRKTACDRHRTRHGDCRA